MYENIGGKIKALAVGSFFVVALGTFFTGVALAADLEAWIGGLVMFGGPIVAWVSSWILYGFGELIVKACEIADNTQRITPSVTSFIAPSPTKQVAAPTPSNPKRDIPAVDAEIRGDEKVCPKCGTAQLANRKVCWSCSQPFNN